MAERDEGELNTGLAVEVSGRSGAYGKTAISGLAVVAGPVYGVLGSNGAGKTTDGESRRGNG